MNREPRIWFALILLALAFLIHSGQCRADDWTRADTHREVAYQIANLADALQTRTYRDNPYVYEANDFTAQFIGREPNDRDTALYFGTLAISHYLIARALPAKWRSYFQYSTAAYATYTVYNNCSEFRVCSP